MEPSQRHGEPGRGRDAEHFLPVRNEMGGSPVWVPGEGVLFWLDAEAGLVYRWDPASAHWGYRSLETPVKALVRKAPRGFMAVTEKGVFFWDPEEPRSSEGSGNVSRALSGSVSPSQGDADASAEVCPPGEGFHPVPGAALRKPAVYYSGAAVDRRGRLLINTYDETDIRNEAGSRDTDRSQPSVGSPSEGGSICLIEPGGGRPAEGPAQAGFSIVEIDRGLALPRGMCLSPDGRRLYLGEMLTRRILVYDYEAERDGVKNRRVLAEMADEDGMPGGLAVDREGFLWCAHWGGWRVTRYAPDGAVDLVIPLPVSTATGVCFGGEGLGDLFVTTSSFGLSDEEWEREPLAGDLFRVRAGTGGCADSAFMGGLSS